MTASHVYRGKRIYVSEFLFVQNTHQTWFNLFPAPNLFTWGRSPGPDPQTCSILFTWDQGAWPSTERPSCSTSIYGS